ncbi:MAG: PRC-barrel domain-containing protein [Victivallales bacterium]
MQQVASGMIGFTINGVDGELGKLKDFYFDDATWTVRYMALETGGWMSGRRTLVSIAALGKMNWASRTINVNLTREQVRNSPHADIDEPISRNYEIALHGHYAWNTYWGGGFYVLPGYGIDMVTSLDEIAAEEESSSNILKLDHGLHNTREIIGNRIHATDGDIGHVEDFIIDEEGWNIRYLVVDLRNWLPGRRVTVSPQWIKDMDWDDAKVFVNISRDAVKRSPRYELSTLITLDYERKMLEHLHKPENAAWVTFKIHAPQGAHVFVAGSFNSWNPSSIRLERDSHGVYATTVLIPPGRIEYKFVVNGTWCNAPECKELVPNAFGSTNSFMLIGHGIGHAGHMHTFSRFSAGQNRPLWSTPMGG